MNMDTKDKIITLASFVYLDKINSFKNYLNKRFSINEDNIFQYSFRGSHEPVILYSRRWTGSAYRRHALLAKCLC